MERRHVFRGHRGPVSALAFRMDSHQLFSGSHDRSIRHWNLENMAYVESLWVFLPFDDSNTRISTKDFDFFVNQRNHVLVNLGKSALPIPWIFICFLFFRFGHEQPVTGLASGYRERCISSGGRDGSVRVWKIVEESQLVFNLAGKQKNGLKGSVECIAIINDDHFLSGADDW